jgi:ATP-dependent helicase YprA (DUF1998 family)
VPSLSREFSYGFKIQSFHGIDPLKVPNHEPSASHQNIRKGRNAIYDENISCSSSAKLLFGEGFQAYLHQSLGWKALDQGNHLILNTSTSSGKSAVFQLAILKAIKKNEEFLFPIIRKESLKN